MSEHSKAFIESDTEALLNEYNLFDQLPIDISKLCRKLGYLRVETEFDEGFSGAALIDGDKKIISINKGQHINRKRFTIAHEICHLRYHADTPLHVDKNIFYRSDSNTSGDWREIEANRFAAAILMPRIHVLNQVQSLSAFIGDDEIEKLAQIFKVSSQAMCIRLKELGII